MKPKRDVKFIIYQALYIFVICIVAIKGANLDLEQVIGKEQAVSKQEADSIRKVLDSLLALGLKPEFMIDTSKFTAVEKERLQKLLEAQIKLQSMPVISTVKPEPIVNPNPITEKIEEKQEIVLGDSCAQLTSDSRQK